LGYGETGTIRDSLQFQDFAGTTHTVDFSSEFKILTVRLLGVLPFDNGVSLLAGLAYADVKQDFSLNIDGLQGSSGDISGNEPAYYAAVQYDWDRFAMRLGYEKYDFDGGLDVVETSITFFYKL